MNAKISLFVICVEAVIYLLYNLHDCTFNVMTFIKHVDVAGLRSTFSDVFHKNVFLKISQN